MHGYRINVQNGFQEITLNKNAIKLIQIMHRRHISLLLYT